jgi:hypothetical protein
MPADPDQYSSDNNDLVIRAREDEGWPGPARHGLVPNARRSAGFGLFGSFGGLCPLACGLDGLGCRLQTQRAATRLPGIPVHAGCFHRSGQEGSERGRNFHSWGIVSSPCSGSTGRRGCRRHRGAPRSARPRRPPPARAHVRSDEDAADAASHGNSAMGGNRSIGITDIAAGGRFSPWAGSIPVHLR